jgi:hypothetical protein
VGVAAVLCPDDIAYAQLRERIAALDPGDHTCGAVWTYERQPMSIRVRGRAVLSDALSYTSNRDGSGRVAPRGLGVTSGWRRVES